MRCRTRIRSHTSERNAARSYELLPIEISPRAGRLGAPGGIARSVRAGACLIARGPLAFRHARLDDSFAALSDATRRGVLEQLGGSDSSITDLAEKFHMTLTGMKKHVGVLEEAGLVTTEKVGRVRTCKLGPR
jgi:hypothetical protein